VLKNLGHRPQVSPLVRVDLTSSCHVDDVKAIRSHDSWVHVPIVQEVSNNLGDAEEKRSFLREKTEFSLFFLNVYIHVYFPRESRSFSDLKPK
jgi:hypothetical protein